MHPSTGCWTSWAVSSYVAKNATRSEGVWDKGPPPDAVGRRERNENPRDGREREPEVTEQPNRWGTHVNVAKKGKWHRSNGGSGRRSGFDLETSKEGPEGRSSRKGRCGNDANRTRSVHRDLICHSHDTGPEAQPWTS
eukprot:scaffold358_cov343-Pavlova_lutheri.AAC.10